MDDTFLKQQYDGMEALAEVPDAVLDPEAKVAKRPPDKVSTQRLIGLGTMMARLLARAKYEEALAKSIAAECRTRIAKIEAWFGPAILAKAKELIPDGTKPRKAVRSGVTVKLRKGPDKVEVVDMGAFYKWDRQNEQEGLSRRSAAFKDLSLAELEALNEAVATLDDKIRAKYAYHTEVRKPEAKAYVKRTGEIPAGLDFVAGSDRVTFEVDDPAALLGDGDEEA